MTFYWGIIIAVLFVWAAWNVRKRYAAEDERDEFEGAFRRMMHERDMLQKDVDYYQSIVHMRADQ